MEAEEEAETSLSMGFLPVEPYVMPCFERYVDWASLWPKPRLCRRPGVSVEIAARVCGQAGLNCTFRLVGHTQFGDNISGVWQGMVREVMDGEVDAAMPAFNPTAARLDVVAFSRPVSQSDSVLVARLPPRASISLTGIFAFHWSVWLLILATVVSMGALSLVFERLNHRKVWRRLSGFPESQVSLGTKSLWRAFDAASMFLQQGFPEKDATSLLVMFGVWGLCSVSFAGIYAGYILVTLLAQPLSLPFYDVGSFADCLERGRCRLITDSISNSYFERLYSSEFGEMLAFRRAVERRPAEIVPRAERSAAILASGDVATTVMVSGNQYAAMIEAEGYGCHFFSAQISLGWLGFPVRFQRRDVLPRLDAAIVSLREVGIIDQLYWTYVKRADARQRYCQLRGSAGSEARAMTVENYLGSLIGLVAGFVFSLAAFAAEFLCRCSHRKAVKRFIVSSLRQETHRRSVRPSSKWSVVNRRMPQLLTGATVSPTDIRLRRPSNRLSPLPAHTKA